MASLNFGNQNEQTNQNCQACQGYNAGQAEPYLFSTPDKGNNWAAGGKGYCQTTKSKVNRDMVEEDRFSTPPRRPQRPTSQQM